MTDFLLFTESLPKRRNLHRRQVSRAPPMTSTKAKQLTTSSFFASNEGYSVCVGVSSGMKDFEQGHSFTLVTPGKEQTSNKLKSTLTAGH